MGVQSRYGNGPHPSLWTGLRAVRGKITISGKKNCLKFK